METIQLSNLIAEKKMMVKVKENKMLIKNVLAKIKPVTGRRKKFFASFSFLLPE